jgi:hypothetical protein
MRAEDRDLGHRDGASYQYQPTITGFMTTSTPNDNYRRIVVSRTIHIRNTRI